MLNLIKRIVKKLPIAFTVNQKYDRQTVRVIRRVCKANSNCVDVGCHKGEILDFMIKYAPQGNHYGFEPIPELFGKLSTKYKGRQNVFLYELALSNTRGRTSFNYVVTNPAYSGLKKRQYDRPNEIDTSITVDTDLLDHVIPSGISIDLIKIDVEGGELQVLEGAIDTIRRYKPVILFEHGKGGSEFYGSTPEKLFSLLSSCGLSVSLLERWLKNEPSLTLSEFKRQFEERLNFFFIAYANNGE